MDIPGTTTFDLPANQVILIQPGLTDSFPWLAQIAACYEMYKFHRIQFQYRNRAATGTQGSVYCAFQNDSEDALFGSKAEMLAYEGGQEDVVYVPQNFDVKISDYMKKYFIRNSPLSSGSDAQLFDVGMFSITCSTNTAIPIAGELLVEYTVELFKPKISQSLGAGYYVNWDSHLLPTDSATNYAQHPMTIHLEDDSSELPYPSYVGVTALGGGAGDALTLPMAGVYFFAVDMNNATGGSNITTVPALSFTSVGANFTFASARNTQNLALPITSGGSMFTYYQVIKVTASGQTAANQMIVSCSGASGINSFDASWWVIQLNPNSIGPEEALSKHPRVRRQPKRKQDLKLDIPRVAPQAGPEDVDPISPFQQQRESKRRESKVQVRSSSRPRLPPSSLLQQQQENENDY